MTNDTNIFNREVIDITHKPKRMQADNLKNQGNTATDNSADNDNGLYYPVNLTVERVIKFFEDRCLDDVTDPNLKRIYAQTSLWLRDYMSRNRKTGDN